jgi:hypothetical protein
MFSGSSKTPLVESLISQQFAFFFIRLLLYVRTVNIMSRSRQFDISANALEIRAVQSLKCIV